MTAIQPPATGEYTPDTRIECDAIGCRELADYVLVAVYATDDHLPFYACLVHVPWAIKELRAYPIEGRGPCSVTQTVLPGRA